MAPLKLCGMQLSAADRRVWKQAIAMLVGLKRRNGFGGKDLAAAVGTAVRVGAAKRSCEDCGVKVEQAGLRYTLGGLGWRFLYSPGPQYT